MPKTEAGGVDLTDTDVDDHFYASRRSRLEKAAAKDDKEGDARIRSRSNPRKK